ncbi:AMP-binding protein [Motiliproteus coralliicola]|uniref:AMP-binding protein n=1 Tax=Motiliproteus coralliicola TaxID=2283196 RepID=UPI000E094B6C|nr:AMP-binding protein [Motiliproteus coralliicola]
MQAKQRKDQREERELPGQQRVGDFGAARDELDFQGMNSLVDLLERSSRRFPDRPAFSNLGTTITYRQLDQQARDFAAYLQNCTSLEPGDRFAIELPNLMQYPVVLLGALRAGLVVVNLNPLNCPVELAHQLRDSGARGLVVLANAADKLEGILDQTDIDCLIVTELGDALPTWKRALVNVSVRYLKKMVPEYQLPDAIDYVEAMHRGSRQPYNAPPRQLDDLALLQYTGGTTGRPKGACLSHRNLLANLIQVRSLLDQETEPGHEVLIAPLPLYHIYSLTVSCLLMIEIGAEVVLITNPRDLGDFVRQLRRCRPTLFIGLNTLFAELIREPGFDKLSWPDLKWTLSGGMPLNPDVAEQWQNLTGAKLLEGYGLTETSPIVSVNPPNAIKMGSIGVPILGTEIRLVDEEGMDVPVSGCGELCVRGPQVMRGYWQQPDETEAVLDPQGWLHTGDIVRLDSQGYLTVIDRKKDMINVSGFSVYPNEVEMVVRAHPDVEDCVVIGIPDPVSGEQVKLFVVASNPLLSVQQIRGYCRERLSGYKVPSQVEFRTELPKSQVGKVLRRLMRDTQSPLSRAVSRLPSTSDAFDAGTDQWLSYPYRQE